MPREISCESHVFAFSADMKPVVTVKSGETVILSTMDCFANQLQSESDKLDVIDWDKVNPATGPVYVEGAEPGDALKVSILKIEIGERGTMATGENFGVLGGKLKGLTHKFIPIVDGYAVFNGKIKVPINKMIGVIGVAPSEGSINCGTPGSHGGNMDNKMITEGADIYFPVSVKGALFAAGDSHAAMGDGEIGVSGVEIPARLTLKLEAVKGMKLSNPYLENSAYISTIASHECLFKAMERSVLDMAEILKEKLKLTEEDTAMLMSMAGNVEVCQVVDPLRTARFVFPKEYIK